MPPFNGQSDQEIMKKVRAGSFTFDDKSQFDTYVDEIIETEGATI